MLKFFRKIRRKIIDEGNLKRYLIYAIGEILLVVFGILIALQINQWQQEKQLRTTEKIMLQELYLDLSTNLEILSNSIQYESEIINDIGYILNHFQIKRPVNDTLVEDLYRTGFLEELRLVNTTYESLKSMGLNVLSSDSLRVVIAQLFEVDYPKEENWVNNIAYAQLTTMGYPMQLKHWTTKNGKHYPSDFEKLIADPGYVSMLGLELGFKKAIISRAEILIEKTENLKRIVLKEIEKLN